MTQEPLKLLVCGGRNFANVPLVWRTLDSILRDRGPVCLVIEGASDDVTGPYLGADYWANQWARSRFIEDLRFHADWKNFGRSAGPIRNRLMIDLKPDLCVAFPGGRGTNNMKTLARAAMIPVMEVP